MAEEGASTLAPILSARRPICSSSSSCSSSSGISNSNPRQASTRAEAGAEAEEEAEASRAKGTRCSTSLSSPSRAVAFLPLVTSGRPGRAFHGERCRRCRPSNNTTRAGFNRTGPATQ